MSFRINAKEGMLKHELNSADVIFDSLRFKNAFGGGKVCCSVNGDSENGIIVNNEIIKTTIVARCKLNFGQNLFIRGSGFSVKNDNEEKEINWNEGIKMTNIGPDSWKAVISTKTLDVAFKFLIDDNQWEADENHKLTDMILMGSGNRLLLDKKLMESIEKLKLAGIKMDFLNN